MFDLGDVSDLLHRLFPFEYSIAGVDNDKASKVLCDILPFEISEYQSGSEVNGWVIPQGWRLNSLQIYKDGVILFEFRNHPFCVPKNTPSIDVKELTYSQLISRINRSASGNKDDFVYDWRNLYKNKELDWSICLTESMVNELTDESFYRVVIDSTFYDSSMRVLEFNTNILATRTIVLNAHNCHPYQANDDVSGMVAAILLTKQWLLEQDTQINLKLIIAPELYGPIFHLNSTTLSDGILGAILFSAVGNEGTLKLQESIQAESEINLLARHIFSMQYSKEYIFPFRTLHGNDEIVFENPPFRISTITLTRMPFPQYHNSSDNLENISIRSIADTAVFSLQIVKALRGNYRYRWLTRGLPKLSDLPYGIYKPVRAHGIHDEGSGEIEMRWHILMNSLPSLIADGLDSLEISNRFQVPILEVIEYLGEWEKAGFIARVEKSGTI